MDRLSKEERSELMKKVRRSGTELEMILRRALHRHGLRYVIGDRRLPGSPDLVFPRYKTVVFVHGCFWHGHSCRQGRLPMTNRDFWFAKISANKARDATKERALHSLGWRVITVWQCEFDKLAEGALDAFATALRSRIIDGCAPLEQR